MADNTFRNLNLLNQTRQKVKKKLGSEYPEKVTPCVELLGKIMRMHGLNEFEAAKYAKDNLSIYQKPGAELIFASAIMEIVDKKYLKDLK